MDLPDVNILVGAFRTDHPDHIALRAWLHACVGGRAAFGMSTDAISGFIRIVTNPRVFVEPATMEQSLAFVDRILARPRCVIVRPGPGHFDLFLDLCREPGVRGNLVPDAYLAALAIEIGARWITRDRDFARFDGLQWHDPVSGRSGG